VAVHFDVDVLDSAHYDFLLFRNPSAGPDAFEGVARGRMRFAQISGILNAVTAEADIVGLAITEYLERHRVREGPQHSPATRQW
jgi:arginase